ISFRVTSKVDSRTILDCTGADKLLGRGDMLFLDASDAQLKRVHGAYVKDQEITQLLAYIRTQADPRYLELQAPTNQAAAQHADIDDALYKEILAFLTTMEEISISLLQRKFRIGYNRAARIIEVLETQGLIVTTDGGKTRKVIKHIDK